MLSHTFFLLTFIVVGWQPCGTGKAVVTLGWQLRKLKLRDIEWFMSGDFYLPLDVWWSSQTQHVQKWMPIFPSHIWQLHLLHRPKALVSSWLLSLILHIWATRHSSISKDSLPPAIALYLTPPLWSKSLPLSPDLPQWPPCYPAPPTLPLSPSALFLLLSIFINPMLLLMSGSLLM